MPAANGPGLAGASAGAGVDAKVTDGRRRTWPVVTDPARLAWPAAYAAAAILLFFCYLRLAGTQPVTGDGASNVLQAWDMLHGNWLLKGWTVTDVSFWTTELPEYVLIEAFHGLSAQDLHIGAALTYTMLVVLASLVAKGNAAGKEGLARALIAAGIMIAPSVGSGVLVVLSSPDHIGTNVPVLLIWLLIDRAPRRWWVPVVAGLMLTWTLDGDQVALITAVAPLVLVCAARAYQKVIQRREPVSGSWFELSLAVAAIGSVLLSDLVTALVRHLGGFTKAPLINTFSSVSAMPGHVWWTVQGVFSLFGADFFSSKLSVSTALVMLHLVGVALVATAVVIGVRRFLANGDLVGSLLTAGVAVNVLLYLFSTAPVTIWSGREIAAVLPFGAALAGRTLAAPVIKGRLIPLLGAVAIGYLIALGHGVTRPQQPAEGQNLANWLTAHHLSYGLSGYGFGPSTTLASGGKVELHQATWLPDRVGPGPEEWKASWYDPRRHYANFVVAPVRPAPPDPFTQAQVRRIFGQPTHVYHFTSQFVIMTYDYNLLSKVS